ncbi:MAG: PD-(D/E)XK motif protein [Kineosporiaceae bacterium]|nr:PD-(D/E)XK motif protein [Kineosporiaceae bacterium]
MNGPADPRQRLQQLLSDLWRQVGTPDGSTPLLTTAFDLGLADGPLRLGRDRDGLPHLLVPLPPQTRWATVPGGEGLSVTSRDLLVDDVPVRFVDLACRRSDLVHVFSGLALDICLHRLAEPGGPAIRAVTSVIEDWRALLDRRSGDWTRSRAAGLFAELTVLEHLVDRDPTSLTAWCGPFGAAQDFRVADRAVEVKATLGSEGRMVRIHGSDQLEEPPGGHLHLAWFRLVEVTDDSGSTVRERLTRIAARVHDPRLWASCLAQLQIPVARHPELDERRFVVVEQRWYRVGPWFPRIVPSSFADGAIPAGVGGVEYLIDLDVIPTAHQVPAFASVLAQLLGPA